ncbi:enoyl-CoA hydratase/isomerase family protein [Pusillimonas sp. SM2304]|uniref:enoyl-CoA hydratase/isomerase family protein n=1 Tax=Pusillimonas sp. SM2304 TaxID=3073241 RepID=UPI0028747C4D|nr:enoyl-CoA hydratase/isomerase family protein [Pusillimonas sp. SM2304]MDS1140453.1 enoyl-CoA hydratase/isomerase family protein [Pusillimonas sp. SM2304]
MSDDVVKVCREGSVAVITLNRPERMNAVNQALRSALIAAMKAAEADTAVRAVVLAGAGGKAFCAGQDLAESAAMQWQDLVPWLNAQRDMYQSVRDLNKPCVAAMNGVAAGAGFQVALCADVRIIAPSTRIGQPEVKAGLASIVGSYLMTLHVSHTHNIAMSLGGELITGERAHEIGLVTELAEPDAVLGRAIEVAAGYAQLPATALRVSKQRFRDMTQAGFDDAVLAGIRAQLECYAHGDPQRAADAFLKRKPA